MLDSFECMLQCNSCSFNVIHYSFLERSYSVSCKMAIVVKISSIKGYSSELYTFPVLL